jgi:crossover junction endodeoxyribonuclease RuvC/BirA family biotin operon repressor/biotin-[acetyl-CoA-carboxylase] ligase
MALTHSQTTYRARKLRRGQTEAERALWAVLRNERLGGWKWKRQVPFGPYFLDFLCREAGLVVELDGGQHGEPEAAVYDTRRTAYLGRQGLAVIRFWNSDVLSNRDGVCDTILRACGGERGAGPLPTLSLSLRGGEEKEALALSLRGGEENGSLG